MGIFDFSRKKKDMDEIQPSPPVYGYDCTTPTEHHFTVNLTKSDLKRLTKEKPKEPDLSHLDENGELPFGWFYQNKEFVNKIENEYRHFLNTWVKARGKDALEESTALKSLIVYIKDAEKLCESKGECFSKWFSDCVADQKYITARESELRRIQKSL